MSSRYVLIDWKVLQQYCGDDASCSGYVEDGCVLEACPILCTENAHDAGPLLAACKKVAENCDPGNCRDRLDDDCDRCESGLLRAELKKVTE